MNSIISSDRSTLLGFIAGMSRSGTTWMARSLNAHPEIAVFGESKFWGKSFIPPLNEKEYSVDELKKFASVLKKVAWEQTVGNSPGCLKNINKQDVISIIEKSIEKQKEIAGPREIYLEMVHCIAELERKRYVIEKTPHYSINFDRIMSYLPWTKTVFIVRNPLEFVVSFKHQWDSKGSRVQENARRKKHSAINALIWRGYMRAVKKAIKCYPEHTMIVNMDEIRVDPSGVLNKVQAFWGVKYMIEDMVVSNKCNTSFPMGEKKRITSEDIFWLKLIAAKELKELDVMLPQSELGFISTMRSCFELIMGSIYIVVKSFRFKKILHLKEWLRAVYSR